MTNVEKVLLAPIQVDFTPHVKKIRMNLMLSSFIALFIILGDIQLNPESTIFGLKFKGLNDELINIGLLILIVYLLVHFLWSAYETLQEWELRVSGTKEAFISADEMDIDERFDLGFPANPRNSTFYYWSTYQANKIGCLKTYFTDIYDRLEVIEKSIHEMDEKGYELNRSDANISIRVQPLKTDIEFATKAIDRIEKALGSDQLTISMKTFDRRYKFFLNSQNIRWLVIDFSSPIILATLALFNIFKVLS